VTAAFRFGPLTIEAAAYGSQGSGILGIRDSGKTYTATLLAERIFAAGIPFVAFDPIGVWRFLRVPGKGQGLPVVVAGGTAGDLALTPGTAPAIVEAAMQNGVSLVLDLFSMELSKADWRRIVRDSVRLLLHRNAAHGLRHVFIEEAAEFAPQKVYDGEVYAEIEKLARMGGNARLGYTLINQRAEEVNKAVLELCDNLFLHRQKGRNSLTALSKWLDIGNVKDHKAIIETLATLPTGECWAWLAGTDTPVRVKVPEKDSLHPDRRIMRGAEGAKVKAAVDVGAFVESMRASLGKVEEEIKANDPKALKIEIARLKKELSGKAGQLPPIDPAAIEEADRRGYERGRAEGKEIVLRSVANMAGDLAASSARVVDEATRARDLFGSLSSFLDSLRSTPAPSPPTKIAAPRIAGGLAPSKPIRSAPHHAGNGSAGAAELTGPQRQLLKALAWWKTMGHERPTRTQLAAIAGWKPKGSNLRNRLAELSTLGLVEYPMEGRVSLTADGITAAPDPDTNVTLIDSIRGVLTRPQSAIFEELLSAKATVGRSELAARVGWEPGGSNLRNRLAELSAIEVVEYPSRGGVRLQDWVTE
jgi:hypothetical protein